jgi:KaiC/GvpD/RAD55 family RecA-like ATPase
MWLTKLAFDMKNKINKNKIEREKIGIEQVDKMIEGGLPKGGIIGLSGLPGVGKSIFTLHFLLEGARKGEKSLYINLEEPLNNINNMINQFDFSEEFFKYVKDGKIVLKSYDYSEYEKIYNDLFEKIKEDTSIKRLVIDTFNCFFESAIGTNIQSEFDELSIRKKINQTFSIIRKKNMTTLLVLETPANHTTGIYYNIPHLVDGLINLDFLELGIIERRIFIPKMRWTNQYRESKNYDISSKGIVVSKEDQIN